MHIDIPANANCGEEANCIFSEAGPSERAYALATERHGQEMWVQVTGWTLENEAVPAWVTLVNDSADGHARLVHGGTAGLRFKPLESDSAWDLDAQDQWGEPLLHLALSSRVVLWKEVFPGEA